MEKIPYDQFVDTLTAARVKVAPGTVWQHYKGNKYTVKDIALLESSVEVVVVYAPVDQPEIAFVRPITSWFQPIDIGGQTVPRFSRQQ